MDRLSAIEESLSRSRKEAAAVLVATLGNTAGARYLSNLCALYADDVISYLRSGKPLDEKTNAQSDAKRQADEDLYANECIQQALKGGKSEQKLYPPYRE
jgi:hypothetical protein